MTQIVAKKKHLIPNPDHSLIVITVKIFLFTRSSPKVSSHNNLFINS